MGGACGSVLDGGEKWEIDRDGGVERRNQEEKEQVIRGEGLAHP